LETIPASFAGLGVDKKANQVLLQLSSRESDVVSLVHAHYNVHGDILRVESDGTGGALLAEGTISVLALDSGGRPVADLDCMATPDGSTAPSGDVGWATGQDGRCSFGVKAKGYTVSVSMIDRSGDRVVLAADHVDVPANGVASITLVVDR
jgi:hypothetical protein